jgi:hypothetical protein
VLFKKFHVFLAKVHMLVGLKHCIKCKCILPQYKNLPEPIQHQFIVFSIIDNDVLITKYAQCNNCGIIHKVIDVCKSEIISCEHLNSLITIGDIKVCLPQKLISILEANNVDLATWEFAKFIIENKMWGNMLILSTEIEGDIKHGKYVQILSETQFRVDTFINNLRCT